MLKFIILLTILVLGKLIFLSHNTDPANVGIDQWCANAIPSEKKLGKYPLTSEQEKTPQPTNF